MYWTTLKHGLGHLNDQYIILSFRKLHYQKKRDLEKIPEVLGWFSMCNLHITDWQVFFFFQECFRLLLQQLYSVLQLYCVGSHTVSVNP